MTWQLVLFFLHILYPMYQTCMMSATSVPLMMELVQSEHSKEEDIEFFNLEPHADYSGVENIKPLEVIEVEEDDGSEEDGMAEETSKKLTAIFSAEQNTMKKKVYLDQNELSAKPHVANDLEVIYANEKVSFRPCGGVLRCSYDVSLGDLIPTVLPSIYRSLLYTIMPCCLTQQAPTRKVF